MKEIARQILQKINESQKIALLPHVNPDWDACGSAFALYLALFNYKKDAKVIFETPLPPTLTFLGGEYEVYKNDEEYGFDLVIAIDSGDRERLGKRNKIFEKAKTTINIDHHITNTNYADINFVFTNMSATGEIIYNLLGMINLPVTKEIASFLYAAILTDTGCFKFSSTTSQTHRVIADLLDIGADGAYIANMIYESQSLNRLLLRKKAIESLKLYEGGKIAVVSITQADLDELGATDDDTEDISTIPRSIDGVEVGIFIKEREGLRKVSLRSKNYVDVSKIASHFGGGGHLRASGFTSGLSIDELREKVVEVSKQALIKE